MYYIYIFKTFKMACNGLPYPPLHSFVRIKSCLRSSCLSCVFSCFVCISIFNLVMVLMWQKHKTRKWPRKILLPIFAYSRLFSPNWNPRIFCQFSPIFAFSCLISPFLAFSRLFSPFLAFYLSLARAKLGEKRRELAKIGKNKVKTHTSKESL